MSRQRAKPLRNCPSCNRAALRPERTAKVDGKEVCDDCYVESIRKKVLND